MSVKSRSDDTRVDVSITGNRQTRPGSASGSSTYKNGQLKTGRNIFSGLWRWVQTHSPSDNMAAGQASYGMTDTMGRMHSDAQFAGSSSVPAHVEMMGLIGMGNNPMVGATVAVAVAIEESLSK